MRIVVLALLFCSVLPAANYSAAGLADLPADTRQLTAEFFGPLQYKRLPRFEKLEALNIVADRSTNPDWGVILGLKSLRSLDLSGAQTPLNVLVRLGELPALESIRFRCRDLEAQDMAAWIKPVVALPKLRKLWFSEYTGPGSELAALGTMKELQELAIVSACFVTDSEFGFLGKMTRLTRLELTECSAARDATLKHVSGLAQLQELRLQSWEYFTGLTGASFTRWTTSGIQSISALKNLKVLSLRGAIDVTDSDLKLLSAIASLEVLDISWCGNLTNAAIESLSGCVKLREIDITGAGFRSDAFNCEGFEAFKNHSCLQKIDALSGILVSDTGIAAIAGIPNLQSLDLSGAETGEVSMQYTDAAIKSLASAQKLQTLVLGRSQFISPEQLRILASLKQLEVLKLGQCGDLNDDSLSAILAFPNLRVLQLGQAWHVTDAGLKHLGLLPKLEWLSIDGSHIQGTGLAQLADLKALQCLIVTNTGVPMVSLAGCSALPALTELRVGCQHEIHADALKGLQQCPRLQSVRLDSSGKITAEMLMPLAGIRTLRRVYAVGEGSSSGLAALGAQAPWIATN